MNTQANNKGNYTNFRSEKPVAAVVTEEIVVAEPSKFNKATSFATSPKGMAVIGGTVLAIAGGIWAYCHFKKKKSATDEAPDKKDESKE